MLYVSNLSGSQIEFNAASRLMDDDLREELHGELAPFTEQ